MPPGTSAQGNRIGLGVGVDDPGQSTLTYLRDINREMSNIRENARAIPANVRANATRTATQRAGEARAESQAVITERTREISILDLAQKRHDDATKRRASDTTSHVIAEGRRRSDVERQIASLTQKELDSLYTKSKVQETGLTNHILAEYERRQRAMPNPYAPGGRNDPNSPENRVLIERARAREAEGRKGPNLTPEAQALKDKVIQQRLTRDQRRAIIENYNQEQARKANLPIINPDENAADVAQQRAAARQRVNEIIAARERAAEERARADRQTQFRIGLRRPENAARFQEQLRENLRQQATRDVREAAVEAQNQRGDPRFRPIDDQLYRNTLAQDLRRRRTEEADRRQRADAAREARAATARETRERGEREAAEAAARFREDTARREAERAARPVVSQAERDRETLAANRAADLASARSRVERRTTRAGAEARVTGPILGPTRADVLDLDATRKSVNAVSEAAVNLRTKLAQIAFRNGGSVAGEARTISNALAATMGRAEALRAELGRPANMRRTKDEITRDLEAVKREMVSVEERARRLRGTLSGGPPGGGGPPGPNLDAAAGRGGAFGTTDIIARISRNILLYQAISGATYGLKDYVTQAVEAARKSSDLGLAMEYAGQRAGISAERYESLTEQYRNLGQSRDQARSALVEATRFAEERPTLVEPLTRAVTNIAAARGLGLENVDQLIEQFRRRESKFYKRSLGKTVEELYEDEARNVIRARPSDSQTTGDIANLLGVRGSFAGSNKDFRKENRTEAQEIATYVQNLSEAQKERIAINAIIREGANVEGEAERRQNTLAGSLDRLTARWAENKIAVGEWVASLTPVQNLVATLTRTFENLGIAQGKVKGTGPGGVITNADVARQGQETSQSGAYRARQLFNDYGGTVAGGLATAAVSGILGRRRARINAAQSTFDDVLAQSVEGGLDQAAAAVRANSAARNARGGIVRSVTTGLTRLTTGITTSVADAFEFAANQVGAQGAAARAQGFSRSLGSGPRAGRISYTEAGDQFTPISFESNRQRAFRQGAQVVGGLGGALIGAQLGSMVADKLNVGPITATTLTIAGGIIGTAAGTAAGNALGRAAPAAIGGLAGALGVEATGSAVAAALAVPAVLVAAAGLVAYLFTSPIATASANRLKAIEAGQPAATAQVQQILNDAKEGRTFYRPNQDLGRGLTARYTPEEVGQLTRDGRASINDFTRDRISDDEMAVQKERQNIEKESNAAMQTLRDEFWAGVAERDRQKAQELLNRQGSALAKLREFVASSYKVGEQVASSIAPENPYVKIFTDGASAAQRMQQEWGHLGDETVKYFTTLENKRIGLARLTLDFENLGRAQQSSGQAARERATRELSPDLNRRESGAEGIARAGVDAAINIPRLQRDLAAFRGGGLGTSYLFDPSRLARAQLDDINRVAGPLRFGEGVGQNGRRAIDRITNEATVNILRQLPIDEVRNNPRFRGAYIGAVEGQIREQRFGVRDAINRAAITAREDDILNQQIRQADVLRQEALKRGDDPTQVGRAFDRLLLARTEGINPNDLSPEQFELRNAAQRREAERITNQETEARDAVKQGLEYQAELVEIARELRSGILSGDGGLLIRVENDTAARIDAEDLRDVSNGMTPRGGLPTRTSQPPARNSGSRYGRPR
jgi:hypothetical protein